jgi:hypothetical protein
MKNKGISYSIVIPDNVPNPKCADLNTLPELVRDKDHLFTMGTINIFHDRDEQIQKLEASLANKEICAIKLFPGHDPFYPIDERCSSIYELCVRFDVPVVIHTGINSDDIECAKYNDPKYAVELCEKYPRLKIVLAHFYWPKMQYCFDITKDQPNIYYDISAMGDPEVVKASGGWEAVVQVLKKVVLAKPANVLFGSDWPMCPVDKHIQLIKDLNLGFEAEEKIFALNAVALYSLDIRQN